MSLSAALIDKVKKGEVVLLLGSGALYGATLPDNKNIPFGEGLRNLLADRFLDGEFKDQPLSYVSQLSISEWSLFTVQEFIKDHFEGLQPANYHYKLAEFKWRRLYTTNYDLLVESIYSNRDSKPKALQKLVTVYSDSNIVDSHQLKENQLEYFKLHGCTTRARENDLPFVLTIDDFNDTLETNRKNMLKTLYEMAISFSIVFVGHSNQDSNIRAIMKSVRKDSPQGQRHYLIKPGAKDVEIRTWEEQKITVLDMGFQGFLESLDIAISPNDRRLSLALKQNEYPIQKLFITNEKPSHALANLLDMDCQFIYESMPTGECKPEDFYKGNVVGWSGIHLNYAIERSLQTRFIQESFKKPEAERDQSVELIVITGAAGSGKTIFLRQLAWLSPQQTSSVPLWVKQGSQPEIESISELCVKTGERIYLFWDNLEINKNYISKFIKEARVRKLKVSIVGCERTNLWSSQCENLDEFSTKIYKLNRMSEEEIDKLMRQLEEFESLNPHLKSLTHEERCSYVESTSERHLLVALYEITTGRRFEEIILDEFTRILPKEAQSIYQTICTLNKYGISVRAGLLSRIHKIDFKEFSTRLFKPLENIVYTIQSYGDDIQYVSRHPEIADIIDRYVLNTPELRINEYLEIIKCLNISYSVDERCFKHLLKAKNMQEVFSNPESAIEVYEFAIHSLPNNAYLLQQMALYLQRTSAHQLRRVLSLLQEAKEIEPYNASILHSLYVVHKENVITEESDSKKENHIREAISYINQMVELEGKESSFSASARIELSLKILYYDITNESDLTKPYIQKQITSCQDAINSFKLRFPEDSYVNELDKNFKRILKDHEGYVKAAKASYAQGHRTPDRAVAIARIMTEEEDYDGAISTLKDAIGNNRNNQKLYFEYAELLRKHSKEELQSDILAYNYERSFSPNDSNYVAQFWFARFAFLSEDKRNINKASELFRKLKSARASSSTKRKIQDIDKFESKHIKYYGTISKIVFYHGFVDLENKDSSIYFDKTSMVDEDIWDLLEVRQRLEFNIGYNYLGPTAINIKPI